MMINFKQDYWNPIDGALYWRLVSRTWSPVRGTTRGNYVCKTEATRK